MSGPARVAPERRAPERRGPDGLGLRRAIPDRMLPSLVAAMAFLASLALAGAIGAHVLARRWSSGAGAILSVQVPDPDEAAAGGAGTRIDLVLQQLARTPGLSDIHRLSQAELRKLLQPWLGRDSISLPLPAVVQLRLAPRRAPPFPATPLAPSLARIAPGTLVEDSSAWSARLLALTYSLQACAGLALVIVGAVAGYVVTLATRAGIATRRQAIEIVHGLGASDGYIAGRFARRAGLLALIGGGGGALMALPVVAGLSYLAAPFVSEQVTPDSLPGLSGSPVTWFGWASLDPATALDLVAALPGMLPLPLLIGLPLLPLAAGLIGWLTAQTTVRLWLRRLP